MSQAFSAMAKDAFTGQRYGRFEVLCKLGEGGMSEVFLALQHGVGGFQRPVVLKRILETIRHQEDFLRMFVREAKIHAALSHGNIAALHDLSHVDEQLFMVIEFVAGATLVEVAKACAVASTAIPLGLSLSVGHDTALALHYAHQFTDSSGRARMVIHRDVAEKNIMVGFDGKTKLLDFGIARQEGAPAHTQVGLVKGTAGYMSPEQIRGEPLDGRSDVFSLGVVLHECITGQRLFKRSNRPDEVHALLNAPIAPPSARNPRSTDKLDAVVLKALSRDREQRFQTAKDLALALQEAAGSQFWDEPRRARFILENFAERQRQIQVLVGDPAATNLDELLDDEPHTVNIRLPSTAELELERPPAPVPAPRPSITRPPAVKPSPVGLPVRSISPHLAPMPNHTLDADEVGSATLIADPDEVRRAVGKHVSAASGVPRPNRETEVSHSDLVPFGPEHTVSSDENARVDFLETRTGESSLNLSLTGDTQAVGEATRPSEQTPPLEEIKNLQAQAKRQSRRGLSQQGPLQRLKARGLTQPIIFTIVGLGAMLLAVLLMLLIH